jgi:hypothetical protein
MDVLVGTGTVVAVGTGVLEGTGVLVGLRVILPPGGSVVGGNSGSSPLANAWVSFPHGIALLPKLGDSFTYNLAKISASR